MIFRFFFTSLTRKFIKFGIQIIIEYIFISLRLSKQVKNCVFYLLILKSTKHALYNQRKILLKIWYLAEYRIIQSIALKQRHRLQSCFNGSIFNHQLHTYEKRRFLLVFKQYFWHLKSSFNVSWLQFGTQFPRIWMYPVAFKHFKMVACVTPKNSASSSCVCSSMSSASSSLSTILRSPRTFFVFQAEITSFEACKTPMIGILERWKNNQVLPSLGPNIVIYN